MRTLSRFLHPPILTAHYHGSPIPVARAIFLPIRGKAGDRAEDHHQGLDLIIAVDNYYNYLDKAGNTLSGREDYLEFTKSNGQLYLGGTRLTNLRNGKSLVLSAFNRTTLKKVSLIESLSRRCHSSQPEDDHKSNDRHSLIHSVCVCGGAFRLQSMFGNTLNSTYILS